MSALSSSSSLSEIQASYDDNASYEEDGSTAKAQAFITACRLLIRLVPDSATKGDESFQTAVSRWRSEITDARAFIAANRTGSRVRMADLTDFGC